MKKVSEIVHGKQDRRIVVSVRNVSEQRWKAVKEKADQQGRKMRAVLDEMMDEWLKRHG